MSKALTVDIIAAIGAERTIPANKGGKTSNVRVGITLSPISIPGITARANTPIKCIPNIIVPITNVPIIIALCIALESL